jgi:putative drug exporter of the RND superfamily
MTGPLYHLGGFCARHHWPVIAAWILVAIALAVGSNAAGKQTSDNLTLSGTGSTEAQDLLQAKLPKQAYGSNPVVLEAEKGKLTDSANKKAVDDTVKSLKNEPLVIRAVSPLSKEGSEALSKDKKIGYISVTLSEGPGDLSEDDAQGIVDATSPASDAGLTVETGGYLGQAVSKADTESSEAIGLTAAVIILMFAFGTATAMFLPIITAVLGLVATLSLITFLGHAAEVPTVAPTLATMIGLGVGIDYSLFIVTRHKQHLNAGMEMRESIARAAATAGGAVFFAGTTVVIALVSLLASAIPFVGTMGYSAAVAVVVAVIAAVTLLPALLGALDYRINSLRVQLGRTHPDDHQPHGWARWARGVVARPWRSLIAAVAVLLILGIPVLNLHLGSSDNGELGKNTTARQAYDLISEGFGAGANGPLLVSIKLGSPAKPDQKQIDQINKKESQQKQQEQQQEQQITEQLMAQGVPEDQAQQQAKQQVQKKAEPDQKKLEQDKKQAESPATDTRLTNLENAIKKDPGIKTVSPATVDKAGTVAVFTAIPTTAPRATATEDTVKRLRDDVIPKAVKGTDLSAKVGGQTAAYIDLADRISSKLPQMILIVVGLSCIVLLLAFRSILLPLKAAVANLLSVAAAYGVVTFVFQEGHGASLIGLDGAVPIASYVPLLMFAILFGLSMDYEVFLLTQIQEQYKEDGNPHEAVVRGLASTGRVITSAALIMVFVFSSFVLNGNAIVKQFGIGLAAAIAIDATIVRCLAVPAVMALFDKAAWWIPGWLDRVLPRISIEGDDYFAKRDEAARVRPPEPEPAAR